MPEKFSAKAVRELACPADGADYALYWDHATPGLGLRITRAGARSFVLDYRARGVRRRITIGSLRNGASIDEARQALEAARRAAAELKSEAKYKDRDPMMERRAARQAPIMSDLAARYLDEHAPRKRTGAADKRNIDKYILPELRTKRVAAVEFADVDALHRKITKAGSRVQANRVVALLSKMFNLAIAWRMRTDNPAKGIQRNPEEGRQRYLGPDELRRLSVALAKSKGGASANAIRLLLLTGARRGEVLGATWDQFDLENGLWTKPSAHTKQKKEHRVPLSEPARLLLSEMRAAAEASAMEKRKDLLPFVFPGRADGKAQSDLKKFWASACKSAGISGVRVHDMRHTYASVLASAGLSLPIIGQLLGHTNPATTARYAHLFDDPLRAATEQAARAITGVPVRKRGAVADLAEQKAARRR